jgi:hypothetical protein
MNDSATEYDSKLDAINAAQVLAHTCGLPAYAFETRHGWQIAKRKPTLRYGKVIECYEGKEYFA